MKAAWNMLKASARIDAYDLLRAVPDHGCLVLPMRGLAKVMLQLLRLLAY